MKKTKKRRIRFDKIFAFLIFVFFIVLFIRFSFNLKISNLYISGNSYLTDQQIIEIAQLEDYPSTLKNLSFQIEKRLEDNVYIDSATVTKKWFREVNITVVENRPLFFYQESNKTILMDGISVDELFTVPTVLNHITDTCYNSFIDKIKNLDQSVLERISEIEFVPNSVDDNRFLLSMRDGNYIYVDIDTFDKVNKYTSILESLPNKKGVLYLDYGNNFEIIE